MLVSEVTGDVPKIIGNEESLYEGDLNEYFRVLFFESSNIYNPYHNFRHMLLQPSIPIKSAVKSSIFWERSSVTRISLKRSVPCGSNRSSSAWHRNGG